MAEPETGSVAPLHSREEAERLVRSAWAIRPGPPTCPMCQSHKWSLINAADEEVGLVAKSRKEGLQLVPTVSLTCTTCAYMISYNLAMLRDLFPEESGR